MSDSVTAAQTIEKFRVLAENFARENPIVIDGQQFFANIESCLDFNATTKPTVEAHEKTPYRKEWMVIQKNVHTNSRKLVLIQFKGKENKPLSLEELDVDTPYDFVHLINLDLTRATQSSYLDFKWRMDYDRAEKTLMLVTNPTR